LLITVSLLFRQTEGQSQADETDRQAQIGTQAIGRIAGRQARQAGRQADRQSGRQAGRKASRQKERRMDRRGEHKHTTMY
jgi:hypothetical protein